MGYPPRYKDLQGIVFALQVVMLESDLQSRTEVVLDANWNNCHELLEFRKWKQAHKNFKLSYWWVISACFDTEHTVQSWGSADHP